MGLVLQGQPGAITDLMPYAKIITGELSVARNFQTSDGTSLYFLGMSLGVGTCARGRTVPVAVFGFNDPKGSCYGQKDLSLSAYAVIARTLTLPEFRQWRRKIDSDCLLGVELLELVEVRDVLIVFKLTGRLQAYVNLV